MSVYLTEEEQAENFKRWWANNGNRIIIAVVSVILFYWAWTQWQAHTEQQAVEASLIYNKLMEAVATHIEGDAEQGAGADITAYAESLKANYSDSQYARYAALMLARLAVDRDDYDAALEELNWVQSSGADEGLSRIVTLRKARVEVARGNLDGALTLLESVDAQDMTSVYAEARGDIYLQLGNRDAARSAYQEALNAVVGTSANPRILELKLNRVTPSGENGIVSDQGRVDMTDLEAAVDASINAAE